MQMLSPHFSRSEASCNCCGKIGPYPENLKILLSHLEKFRAIVGKPVIVKPMHCMYRCPKHNEEVGGVPGSYHTLAMACDCHVDGMTVDEMAAAAHKAGFGGIGKYYSSGFVHLDVGPWNRFVGD